MRSQNLNALERVEDKKVRVTRDDVGRVTANGEFEELVVLRITAGGYPHIHINPFSLTRQSREKSSNNFLIDVSAELFSIENFVEFGECFKRKQDFSCAQCQIQCLARF